MSAMFIFTAMEYLTRFGFSLTLSNDEPQLIQNQIGILLRVIFSFLCILGGGIAILKQNMASYSLLIMYVVFNILL
jgi:hypothetical protein